MKRSLWLPVALSALVMVGTPWAAVTFAPGDWGMAACFLLFFGVNPLYSLLLGVWSGMDLKKHWFQPVVSAVLFLGGTWIFFDPGEMAFVYYCAVYLLISLAAMTLGKFLGKLFQ